MKTWFVLDTMIAATANVHWLTVVTWNVGDFIGFDVAILNPFSLRTLTSR